MHEIVHALQHQSFAIDELYDAGTFDEQEAFRALREGDASLATNLYEGGLNPRASAALFRALTRSSGFATAEAFQREVASFRYADGLRFADALWSAGGFARINVAYKRLPRTTQEILFPAMYFRSVVWREPALPAGPGEEVVFRDRLGALGLVLFVAGLAGESASARLAEAWRGDRAELRRTAAGTRALWAVALATEGSAQELAALAAKRCSVERQPEHNTVLLRCAELAR